MRNCLLLCALIFFMCMSSIATAGNLAKSKYPIILVPGVIGFDTLLGSIDYWYGMESKLRREGATVYSVALTGWNGVYEGDVLPGHSNKNLRGPQLEEIILYYMNGENTDGVNGEGVIYERVNIIAHSHGATTSRYFLKRHPDKVASLTTIAGPHKGTPAADFAWECLDKGTQSFLNGGINFLLGDMVALISGNFGLLGTQDTWLTLNHFRKEGITNFNKDFPCPGLPYSIEDGEKVYHEGIEGGYGEACQYEGDPMAFMSFYDEDMDEIRSGNVYFFSWMGDVGHRAVTWVDPMDISMVATNILSEGYNYFGDADGFVPVASSRFGKVLNTRYYWNHLDEINQTLGIRYPWSSNPKTVIYNHVTRLKKIGL